MKKAIKFTMLSLVVVSLLPFAGAAGPKKPKAPTCPVCHMPLSMKKTKADPVAVRLKKGDKVMYCCAQCKMPPSVLVKVKPSKAKAPQK
ncbi:MAG TPA: hypothetical protein VKT78_11555 [Fimbriimonadaceae bacterium]|nr:hypothetical protein [Fimbriimonadaceae bacterium]